MDATRRRTRGRRLAWARGAWAAPLNLPGEPSALNAATAHPAEARTRGWFLDVEVIDRERLLRGWTQRELARQARVNKGTLGDMLARRRRPTLGTVRAICTALDLSLDRVIVFQ